MHKEYTWLDYVGFIGCKKSLATEETNFLYIQQTNLTSPVHEDLESLQVHTSVRL